LVGRQEGHPACKKSEWLGAGMVICLERGAAMHMAQLMPLPLNKIQIGFTFLVPAYLGSPRKRAIKHVCVNVCVCDISMFYVSANVGSVGIQGPKGQFGLPGQVGASGIPGVVGPQGFTGRQGPDGQPGDRGDPGNPGQQGQPGGSGLPGFTGDTGPLGPIGSPGSRGFQGASGFTGATGFTGNDSLVLAVQSLLRHLLTVFNVTNTE